jgi:hypothetical protein
VVHDAHWINDGLAGSGNILLINNGFHRGYTSVDELAPPVDDKGQYMPPPYSEAFGPEQLVSSYKATIPGDFFTRGQGSAQILPNGNLFICESDEGRFFEVNPDGEVVWEYINPVTDTGPLGKFEEIPLGRYDQTRARTNQTFRAKRYPSDYSSFSGRDLTPDNVIELDE